MPISKGKCTSSPSSLSLFAHAFSSFGVLEFELHRIPFCLVFLCFLCALLDLSLLLNGLNLYSLFVLFCFVLFLW
ncbi:hypothetical protein EUGRSUZ_A01651 [Eucalyptus grandis]|uniref:Uncharacterized protein n=2 Tax=Eucalyptus grandis TaxID=71139 RepID=A0ACC3M3H9_EUCGR|nr:hypothetical protein EUGRSUZ_A01651 [Eucalyptus grandis]